KDLLKRERPPRGRPFGHRNRQILLAREQAFALRALALQLAIAADGLRALAGPLLARLLVVASQLHLAEDAFTLHLLFQRLQRLVDIVVANDDLQRQLSWPVSRAGVDIRRVMACPPPARHNARKGPKRHRNPRFL